MSLDEQLTAELAALEERGLRRHMRTVAGPQANTLQLDGRLAVNFSSNNYLGLANHPALAEASRGALAEAGAGSGASRLIAGNFQLHQRLEVALAQGNWPSALLFNSGYQANLGLLSALAGPDDLICSDQLNHASLIDGCRLSRARVAIYEHGNLDDLARHLDQHRRARRRFVVSDTIFSMDGDEADVPALRKLADAHGATLLLDEAHAFGTAGPRGLGLAAAHGVHADAIMATFSKALGSFGAFVAGSQPLTETLLNRARGFVFTTALPPAVIAASLAALTLVRGAGGDQRRAQLSANIERFAAGLGALGRHHQSRTPIFPILIGDERRTMETCERLLARGFYAQGIRPPTVPPGTSRLRISLMATHTPEQIDGLLEALAAVLPR